MKSHKKDKLNVGVIFGGKSVEHDISIITGVQTLNNLDQQKYNIFPIYITKEGKWLYSQKFFNIKEFVKTVKKSKEITNINLSCQDSSLYRVNNKKHKFICKLDFVFLATHGANGENGSLQGYLDMCMLPYSSCGVSSSAVCMDKSLTKTFLIQNNINTAKHICLTLEDNKKGFASICQKLQELNYPLIVKPGNLGSSIGVSLCKNKSSLKNALSFAFLFDRYVLVEEAVENLREFNIAVMGNSLQQELSDIEEVFSKNGFLTFEAKYLENAKSKGMEATNRIIPAKIPNEIKEIIEENAKNIFKILGCKGIVRIDFLFDNDKKTVFLNEINTIPGSLSNYLWKSKKIGFATLLDKLLDYSMQEQELETKKITNFSSNALSKFENSQKLEITK